MATASVAGLPVAAFAQTTIDFEQHPPGTEITKQYASHSGAGQGVTFGPLPGGVPGEGYHPVVRTPPAGQARSGAQVADIATCVGCEFFTPRTTGTLATPRSQISVYVGYLGEPARCRDNPTAVGCALVSLRAFDANGAQVGESSVLVARGAGVNVPLSVSNAQATIVGFEISARPMIDDSKPVAIDDLTLGPPPSAPAPDFTLNPATTDVTIQQGQGATNRIAIGRIGGSTGDVDLSAEGLPGGVSATFAPDPAGGTESVLTFAAGPNAAVGTTTVTVTGTPQSASAGPAPRRFTLRLDVQPACPQVRTAQALVDRLAEGFKCIFVTGEIDLATQAVTPPPPEAPTAAAAAEILGDPATIVTIPEGVTLMGGRSPASFGGFLTMSRRVEGKTNMLRLGSNTRVTGLSLRGYRQVGTQAEGDGTTGIYVDGETGVSVDNNELYGWPAAAVAVADTALDAAETPQERRVRRAIAPRITRNFIHNNVQCKTGYGVSVAGGGFARVDRNVFVYNRHDVAADGTADGYLAERNLSLTSAPTCATGFAGFEHYNQQYDVHGTGDGGYGGRAGGSIVIRNNTIRGAQQFFEVQRRPAFYLRGSPEEAATFVGNAVHHQYNLRQRRYSGRGAPVVGQYLGSVTISTGAVRLPGLRTHLNLVRQRKLVIRPNRRCLDTAHELTVGDFDGDGRDDVFQGVGTLWVYSPSGFREWFFLNDSELRLANLGVGDFNGDRKADVFTQHGSTWLLSEGGTAPFAPLPTGSSIPIRNYRFHDFDGDRRTDVFRTDGRRLFISSAAAGEWQPLAALRGRIGDFRFGDFDGDGRTDVFSLANNQWSVSLGGATGWMRLNRRLSSSLDGLAFGDFDGDGKTDVIRSVGRKWEISSGGAAPWRTLAFNRRATGSLSVGTLIGDFDGDGRDDVLQHGERGGTNTACWARRAGTIRFRSFDRFRVSFGGVSPPKGSIADMR